MGEERERRERGGAGGDTCMGQHEHLFKQQDSLSPTRPQYSVSVSVHGGRRVVCVC